MTSPRQALLLYRAVSLAESTLRLSSLVSQSTPRQPSIAVTVSVPSRLAACFHANHRAPARKSTDSQMPSAQGMGDLGSLDIFGSIAVPSTSIDICLPAGFRLNNGAQISDGNGVLLVGGEAFLWRPWEQHLPLVNAVGQWEVANSAFGLLGLVWPRPDLLILGLGPETRPLSPETKRYISALGMRVEALDTINAASQFNLLATERGVDDVAAALVPIGLKTLGARRDKRAVEIDT